MKKGTIITGPAGSGKTKLAREMAGMPGEKQVVWLSGRSRYTFNNPFILGAVTEDTKFIVFDDGVDTASIDFTMSSNLLEGGFTVQRQAQPPMEFKDPVKVIIILDETDQSFLAQATISRRFDIINLGES